MEGSKPGTVHGLLEGHEAELKRIARHLKVESFQDLGALRAAGGELFKDRLDRIEADLAQVGRVLRITFDIGNSTSVKRFIRKAIRKTRFLRQASLLEFLEKGTKNPNDLK